jgi:hypothetical protein
MLRAFSLQHRVQRRDKPAPIMPPLAAVPLRARRRHSASVQVVRDCPHRFAASSPLEYLTYDGRFGFHHLTSLVVAVYLTSG